MYVECVSEISLGCNYCRSADRWLLLGTVALILVFSKLLEKSEVTESPLPFRVNTHTNTHTHFVFLVRCSAVFHHVPVLSV